jgi:glycine/D-amino acid oxidase-like deaminating enzyme
MPENNPPLSVLVIGAGIVGASIAYHLADQGAQVQILDLGDPGQGASAVSFAWINARDKNPRPYQDLNRRSMEMWDRFARRLGGDIGLTWGGEIRWVSTLDGAQTLAERVKTLQSWGYPIQLLNEQAFRSLEPGITPGRVTGVSYSKDDGHVDTQKVIQACLDGAVKHGAVVSPGMEAVGLKFSNNKGEPKTVSAVIAGGQALSCDVVVLAGDLTRPGLLSRPGSPYLPATPLVPR